MVFEQIEKLKQEYTDKYVIVDDTQPELRRFSGQTGTVRTVNMSGRALVEFDAYDNIGWYDIDVDFLRIIEKPLKKEEAPKAAAKPADKAKPAAAQKPSAKKPAAMSPADILAAARGGAAAKPDSKTASPKADGGKLSAADILAAARGGAAPAAKKAEPKSAPAKKPASKPAAKADPAKMSVADILAAARGGDATTAAPQADDDIEVVEEPVAADEESAHDEAGEEVVEKKTATKPIASGPLPTNVDDILAFCRARDGS